MPAIQSAIFKSKDGKFMVHKTTITDIKPVNYYETVIEKAPFEELEELSRGLLRSSLLSKNAAQS